MDVERSTVWRHLGWSKELAQDAQAYAEKCILEARLNG
jgi:hypothetical protein